MRLKFLRSWRAYRVGQVVEIPAGLAAELVSKRVAVEDRQAELLETATVDVETRKADVTPRRKRRQ